MKRLRQYFVAGLLSVAPLAITAWVLWQIYRLVDGFVRPWLERFAALQHVPGFFLTLAGVAVLVLLLILVGALTQNVFGVALLALVERWLRRVPVARVVFETTKQIGEALLGPQRHAFERVALFEYPRRGMHAIGFVTADDGRQDTVAVFLATTPNPTTGFLLLIQRTELRYLDLSIEEAMRLIISGGALLTPDQAQRLAAASGDLRGQAKEFGS